MTSRLSGAAPLREVRVHLPRPAEGAAPPLDDDQQRVVAHVGGPLLVLAGPGTGKTTTIVEAAAARLCGPRAMRPDEVAVLTFSRRAAAEVRSRLAARLPAGAVPVVSTFHSFAWRLLAEQSGEFAPQALLTGAEQELAVRELLGSPDAFWARWWPEDRRESLRSPGLAEEVIGFMAAARAAGWEPADVDELAARAAAAAGQRTPSSDVVPPEWPALARFFELYLQVLDWQQAVDYSEAVHRARLLVSAKPELQGRFRAIYVDEYQDTDPAQVGLLAALAVPQTTLVAVGDPDQAIYRFRGADVRGILGFPDQFPDALGAPAPTVVLRRTRRFGVAIRAVADRWIDPVGLGGLPVAAQLEHRRPISEGPDGCVELRVFGSAEDEADGIADLLRRAHLDADRPLPWSDLAVLVRSGPDIVRLERALVAADVPVVVPPDERPLGQEPALAPLITGLRLAADPSSVSLPDIEAFLSSPLVGLTALQVRRLQRALRLEDVRRCRAEGCIPTRTAGQLLSELFAPELPDAPEVPTIPIGGLPVDLAQPMDQVLETIAAVRRASRDLPEQLWLLWSHGSNRRGEAGRWARQLRARALRGGSGAHAADATLDAALELFRVAERMPKGTDTTLFIDALVRQRVPAVRSADAAAIGDGVHLMTAHRAKGGQWPVVVLAGLQQDRWPDSRGPVSLLGADRIGPEGLQPPRTRRELLDDERRLAYVAATRAQRRLVLTAVESPAGDDAPSGLFDEASEAVREGQGGTSDAATDEAGVAAAPDIGSPVSAGPRERLNPAALVASLRTALADPATPAAVQQAAAVRLAQLHRDLPGIGALAPAADPQRWWGVVDSTIAPDPLIPADAPVRLSATALSGLAQCPTRWFLQRRAEASTPRPSSAGFGSLLHAAIAAVHSGELPAEAQAMADAIRPAFDLLPYEADWEAARAWQAAREAIDRFLTWHGARGREVVAAELDFDVVTEVPGDQVRLVGAVDLVDVGPDGVDVVDFKTGKTVPTRADAACDLQLGVYQRAIADVEQVAGRTVAGARLVYLAKGSGKPTCREQAGLTPDDSWLDEAFADAVHTLRSEELPARPDLTKRCERCSLRPMCPAWGQLEWIDTPAPPEPAGDPSMLPGFQS